MQYMTLLILASAYGTVVYSRVFHCIADNSTEGSKNITMGDVDFTMCCKIFTGIQACYEKCINVSISHS